MSHGRPPRQPRYPANVDPLSLACKRARKISADEINSVMQPLELALTRIREGVATEWNWSQVVGAVNTAMAVEKQGVIKGIHAHLFAAELALQSVYRRATAAGAWKPTALHAIELDAISTAVNLHKFQLGQLSQGELLRALDYAEAEVKSTGGRIVYEAAPCPSCVHV